MTLAMLQLHLGFHSGRNPSFLALVGGLWRLKKQTSSLEAVRVDMEVMYAETEAGQARSATLPLVHFNRASQLSQQLLFRVSQRRQGRDNLRMPLTQGYLLLPERASGFAAMVLRATSCTAGNGTTASGLLQFTATTSPRRCAHKSSMCSPGKRGL